MGQLFVLLFALTVYFLPTIVGWNKKAVAGISILNLFLGWTVLGWIIALIWAAESPVIKS